MMIMALAGGTEIRGNIMKQIINVDRILCPVVPSLGIDEGLECAVALARAYDAKLFVCHFVEDALMVTGNARTGVEEALKRSVLRLLDSSPCSSPLLDWEIIVAESLRPAEGIVEAAKERNVDLIAMSSRRRPFAAALLGSTVETVTRTAPCPVLVTRVGGGRSGNLSRGITLRRLLVATDFSADSELALQYTLSLAQEYQSDLHLLHVMNDSPTKGAQIRWDSPDTEGPYHAAARRLHESVPQEAHLWCSVTNAVREGKPHYEIFSYAVEHDIDLLCIGAHGNEFQLGRLFGSTADRILRQSPCPVLVVGSLKHGVNGVSQAEVKVAHYESFHQRIDDPRYRAL
jgi:nucleotide-binding universal stress UspA family protein